MIESSINTFPIPTHLKCHQAYHPPTLCHSPWRGLRRGSLSEEKKQQQRQKHIQTKTQGQGLDKGENNKILSGRGGM